MSVINTNVGALSAQKSLSATSRALSVSMERLSSGIRINSAKDDAAGSAIVSRMTARIQGYSMAIRNANDGISVMQIAEGDLNQISSNLLRIRELAVQSANGSNTQTDRDSLNQESSALALEVDRLAQVSGFNGFKLLDGTFTGKVFQVGSGNNSNEDQFSVSLTSARANSIGNVKVDATSLAVTATANMTINGVTIATSVAGSDLVSTASNAGSSIAKAAAINASTALTGVTAVVNATEASGSAMTAAALTGTIVVNGVTTASITTTTDAAQSRKLVVDAINAISARTGVTAADDTTTTGVKLTAADGRNIVTSFGANQTAAATGIQAAGTKVGTYSLKSPSSFVVAGTIDHSGLTAGTYTIANSGSSVAGISLASDSGARSAIDTVDGALITINNTRSAAGAYQSRLTAAINNLEISTLNLSASRSRINDTDYAKETTSLAKSQIITQAATAMLAQANQSSQSVLALLK
jgi:flagellin